MRREHSLRCCSVNGSRDISKSTGPLHTEILTLPKGAKDRYALLPPILLERLRTWWRHAHSAGQVLPGGYLFPGLDPLDSMSTRQLNRAVHEAAKAAHIDKRVTMHTLRHYPERRTMPSGGRSGAVFWGFAQPILGIVLGAVTG
jgi:integrase/recombinase XerD